MKKPKDNNYIIKEGRDKGRKIYLSDFMWSNFAEKQKEFVPAKCAEEILFRASSIKQIFTNPKNKKDKVSAGTKTFLRKLWLEKTKNVTKIAESKYTKKGTTNEGLGVDMLNEATNSDYIQNDECYFENEWVCGTPDLIADCVLDIKCPFEATTYYAAVDEPLNKMYYYQLQAYMFLLGLDKAYLVYTLTNTPEVIVNDELRKIQWKESVINTDSKDWLAFEAKFRKSHRYEDDYWFAHEKITIKSFPRDEAVIEEFKVRIKDCRDYMNEHFFKIKKDD